MTAEEYLKQVLSEFDDKEESNDKYIAVYMRTIKAMQDFARLKCKEQREICSERAGITGVHIDGKNYFGIDKQSILNSPEPEL